MGLGSAGFGAAGLRRAAMAAAAREASATANKANVRPMRHLHLLERASPAPDLAWVLHPARPRDSGTSWQSGWSWMRTALPTRAAFWLFVWPGRWRARCDGPRGTRSERVQNGHALTGMRPGALRLQCRDPREVGSPREIAPPRLPRIRTCGLPASGSSVYGLAARYTLCTTQGGASG